MLLERRVRNRDGLHAVSQRFHLSRREHETVCHLVKERIPQSLPADMQRSIFILNRHLFNRVQEEVGRIVGVGMVGRVTRWPAKFLLEIGHKSVVGCACG
mgnify:CR=1 FL=1